MQHEINYLETKILSTSNVKLELIQKFWNVESPVGQAQGKTNNRKKYPHTLVKKGVMKTKKTSYTSSRLSRITQIYGII